MPPLLFSYGTLQQEKTQLQLFGRILQGTPDTLRGYKIVPIEITDEAFLSRGEHKDQLTIIISEDKNDNIKGMVLEMTEEELLVTDKYEPGNYKRVAVVLESGKEAWIYMVIATT